MNTSFIGSPRKGLGTRFEVEMCYNMHQTAKRGMPSSLQDALSAAPKALPGNARRMIVRYFGIVAVLDDLLSNDGQCPTEAWRMYKYHSQFVHTVTYKEILANPLLWDP